MKKIFISIAMMALAITACKKETTPDDPQGDPTYAVKTDGTTRYDVTYGDKNSLTVYVASANGFVDPNNLTINLKADPTLVAEYNKTRTDTTALMLPSDAYKFKETSVIIYKNNKKSIGTEISIEVKFEMADTLYVLPVAIESISGSSKAAADPKGVLYIVVNKKFSAIDKGKGTKAEPYLIYEKKDLMSMKDKLEPEATAQDNCVYFKMMMDVDLGLSKETSEIEDWQPLNTENTPADGTRYPYDLKIDFNGNGHTIKNLVSCNWTYASMFGVVYGDVYDLTFVDPYIEGEYAIGVVGGYAGTEVTKQGATEKTILHANIRNVKVVNGHVNNVGGSKNGVGGLIGRISTESVIENSSFDGKIEASKDFVGGIVGYETGTATIRNCSTSGVLAPRMGQWHGGIAGGLIKPNTSVENCFTTMSIHAINSEDKLTTGRGNGGIIGTANQDSKAAMMTPYNVVRKCIAWCDVISTDALINQYSSGAIVAFNAITNTCEDCWYRDGLVLTATTSEAEEYFAFIDQPNSNPSAPQEVGVECDFSNHYKMPYNGKKAVGKTASDIARELEWDTTIWDLSGDIPVLK